MKPLGWSTAHGTPACLRWASIRPCTPRPSLPPGAASRTDTVTICATPASAARSMTARWASTTPGQRELLRKSRSPGDSSAPIVAGSLRSASAYGLPRSSAGRRTADSTSWPLSRVRSARPMEPVAPVTTIIRKPPHKWNLVFRLCGRYTNRNLIVHLEVVRARGRQAQSRQDRRGGGRSRGRARRRRAHGGHRQTRRLSASARSTGASPTATR